METITFESVNLAELLPRIPESIRNGLPFGLVKLDLTGKILEYNMAEGELTGVDPNWALGKNFFDDVAMCTKTPSFYGRFVEGIKAGFMNIVFNFNFVAQSVNAKVQVRMFTMPDGQGKKCVMVMVKRADNKPLVTDAFPTTQVQSQPVAKQVQYNIPVPEVAKASTASTVAVTKGSKHQDILKF